MLVSKIIQKKGAGGVATVGPNAKVAEVAALLVAQRIDMVVVCDPAQKILGVVTDSDIMRRVAGCKDGSHVCILGASDVMIRRVVTCGLDDDLNRVRALMSERGLRRIPVIDDEGQFLGLVSMRDALLHIYEQADFEEKMLEEYFLGLGYH